jgi:hypothetical protein
MKFQPKLDNAQREAIMTDERPVKALAEAFGVTPQTIYNIRAAKKKNGTVEAPSIVPEPSPDWEYHPEDSEDRLRVPQEVIPNGMVYQWITFEVFGQPQPQKVSRWERQGWRPVPAERHKGLFMPMDFKGAIEVDGLRLMERPAEIDRRARAYEASKANNQMASKKQQLTGGNIPGVSLETQHPSALQSNMIRGEWERIAVPKDK